MFNLTLISRLQTVGLFAFVAAIGILLVCELRQRRSAPPVLRILLASGLLVSCHGVYSGTTSHIALVGQAALLSCAGLCLMPSTRDSQKSFAYAVLLCSIFFGFCCGHNARPILRAVSRLDSITTVVPEIGRLR